VNQVPFGPAHEAPSLVSLSGIVPSRRYSVIGFYQSTSGLGGLMTAITSPSGLELGAIGPTEAPKGATGVSARPFSPSGVPGMGTEVPLSREVPSERIGTSSSSWIESLNKSYTNTRGEVGS
jgi:hypothetical protein